MIVSVKPSKIHGAVEAPPSKSYTHRAVALASLSEEKTIIRKPLIARDTKASINASKKLGVNIAETHDGLEVKGLRRFRCPDDVVNVENSGTTLRIYTGLSALVADGYTVLTGDESIRRRPVGPLLKSLHDLGVECWSTRGTGTAPVVVKGGGVAGGETSIKGSESSQYITSLLLAGLAAAEPVQVSIVDELVSKPYVEATVKMVELFGAKIDREGFRRFTVKPQSLRGVEFTVPGDFGSAAFLIAAAHLTGGHVRINNLDTSLPQADSAILRVAEAFGSKVEVVDGGVEVYGGARDADVELALTDSPDLVPVAAAIAALNNGRTRIYGVAHARLKESDRISTVAAELRKLGVKVLEQADGMVVEGSREVEGGVVLDSHGDHRLFMAFTVLGLALKNGLKVAGAESADVSYPNFLNDIIKIGAQLSFG
ncbi:MAG: 3-phosphoshikimate 1-carboxyvinyltransferase [Candidatus Caldarchaeum sp.]|nr:3-phosphoshikimate 1-carboxyvinyltransferase [Candidatus Caldarchaeum sp.]